MTWKGCCARATSRSTGSSTRPTDARLPGTPPAPTAATSEIPSPATGWSLNLARRLVARISSGGVIPLPVLEIFGDSRVVLVEPVKGLLGDTGADVALDGLADRLLDELDDGLPAPDEVGVKVVFAQRLGVDEMCRQQVVDAVGVDAGLFSIALR